MKPAKWVVRDVPLLALDVTVSPPDAEPADRAKKYLLLAAPSLKATAEVATSRGDPELYNDMASMLALLAMAGALTRAYLACRKQFPGASPLETLEAIPVAVCALVFARSGLEPIQVEDCLQILSTANQMLLKEGVLGPQEAM